MGKKIVAGNWKMNLLKDEGQKLTSEIVNMANDEVPSDVTLVLCVPYVHLSTVKPLLSSTNKVSLGAQNCHSQASGAYTGEVSVPMLKGYGVEYVIIGHSERREYFKEGHKELAEKVEITLEHGLTPIFCCGEVLGEREQGKQNEVVELQLKESLFHLSAEQFGHIVIAYEPVWAIGTGKTATSGQAQEMHQSIRKMIADHYGEAVAKETSILYGGSCKPSNAAEIFEGADVDGGLIGGASLKSRDFIDIAKAF